MTDEQSANSTSEQLLTFRLADAEFGVGIQRVQGIQGWDKVTEVPRTPRHVLGVIELRGRVVPIIDLRTRLGYPDGLFTSTTVVIVVRVEVHAEQKTFGLVVDAVSEVRDISREERKASPEFGAGVKTEYMLGLAASNGHMTILLDLDALMSDADFDEEIGDCITGKSPVEAVAQDTKDEPALDAEAIEASFELLAPRGEELVERFYSRLFEAYPAVQPMFENADMAEQKRKLLASIATVVSNVRQPDKLAPVLGDLGRRHEAIGAKPEHYEAVAATLVGVLKEMAADAWNERFEAAWSNALAAVAAIMLEAYEADDPETAVA